MPGGQSGDKAEIARFLKKREKRPNYDAQKDLFIALFDRKLVGYLDLFSEPGIARTILDCFVLPQHRRCGLGNELINRGLHRSVQLRAQVAHVKITEDNFAAEKFLSELGFAEVHCFLELEADLVEVFKKETGQVSHYTETFKTGEEACLADIQARVFSGSWGFSPNTADEIKYYLDLTNSELEDILVLRIDSKIAGYSWAHELLSGRPDVELKRYRIHMFGIDPPYRRKGLGKKLLWAQLNQLRNTRAKSIELTVDDKNLAACSLYFSAGFKKKSKSLWYEKRLDKL
ncbi:GNAT family N-acetyltransferase [Acidobacteriota bacterium]